MMSTRPMARRARIPSLTWLFDLNAPCMASPPGTRRIPAVSLQRTVHSCYPSKPVSAPVHRRKPWLRPHLRPDIRDGSPPAAAPAGSCRHGPGPGGTLPDGRPTRASMRGRSSSPGHTVSPDSAPAALRTGSIRGWRGTPDLVYPVPARANSSREYIDYLTELVVHEASEGTLELALDLLYRLRVQHVLTDHRRRIDPSGCLPGLTSRTRRTTVVGYGRIR